MHMPIILYSYCSAPLGEVTLMNNLQTHEQDLSLGAEEAWSWNTKVLQQNKEKDEKHTY